MFKKRSLVVNVVNNKDLEPPQETVEVKDHISWGAHASVLMDNAVVGGALLIGTYFLADTLRSVAIHTAVTKITPTIVVEAAKK